MLDARTRPTVGAVITAFEPTEALVTAVRSALPQTRALVVVDDGSRGEDALAVLRRVADLGATVVRQESNRGIGAALNAGVAELCTDDAVDGVLTLDQDSALPVGFVDALVAAAHAAHVDGVAVGMVGPGAVAGMRRRESMAERAYAIGGEPIQSGLLIPRHVLEELGGFREDLFIDGVDSDFYLRARRRGYQCVVAPGAALEHRLGRGHRVAVAGRSVELTVASDFRYYYQVRNLIHVVREHGRADPRWSLGAVGRELRHLAIVTAAVPGRAARLREARRGLADGLRGRTGRRPEGPAAPPAASPSEDGPRPSVSVCMAAWNGADYIAEQIASILEQLRPDDELVVVDDASGDDTAAVVAAIADPRLRLIRHEANAGYVRTFEDALRAARGELLLLADQDDLWLPGRLEAMAADLRSAGVVATNLTTLGGPASIRGPFGQPDWHLRASASTHRRRNVGGILAGNMPYYGCAMGIRRDVLESAVLPFPAFLDESHDLWIALVGNLGGQMLHDERRTVARRYHESNASPNRPRGVLPALRSRALLLRCIAEIVRHRR